MLHVLSRIVHVLASQLHVALDCGQALIALIYPLPEVTDLGLVIRLRLSLLL